MNSSITVVIHTHNEENTIAECIESAKILTDSIIIIDMESTDKTRSIVKELGIKLFSIPFRTYVEPARKFGIQQAKTEWVFILDSDERMTEDLSEEIKQIIREPSSFTYFKVPRKNIFGKRRWLQHGGWWPDTQIRFLNKKAFKDWPEQIHSTPRITGEMGQLKQPFLHYFHGNLHSMVEKTTVYENIEAQLLYEAGRPVKTSTFFRKFFGELFRRLIRKQGYLDGTIGIIESIYQSYSKTITYLYLYEKKKSSTL